MDGAATFRLKVMLMSALGQGIDNFSKDKKTLIDLDTLLVVPVRPWEPGQLTLLRASQVDQLQFASGDLFKTFLINGFYCDGEDDVGAAAGVVEIVGGYDPVADAYVV